MRRKLAQHLAKGLTLDAGHEGRWLCAVHGQEPANHLRRQRQEDHDHTEQAP